MQKTRFAVMFVVLLLTMIPVASPYHLVMAQSGCINSTGYQQVPDTRYAFLWPGSGVDGVLTGDYSGWTYTINGSGPNMTVYYDRGGDDWVADYNGSVSTSLTGAFDRLASKIWIGTTNSGGTYTSATLCPPATASDDNLTGGGFVGMYSGEYTMSLDHGTGISVWSIANVPLTSWSQESFAGLAFRVEGNYGFKHGENSRMGFSPMMHEGGSPGVSDNSSYVMQDEGWHCIEITTGACAGIGLSAETFSSWKPRDEMTGNVEIKYGWGDHGYGVIKVWAIYPRTSPIPNTCEPNAIMGMYDLVENGTVTAGDLQAFDVSDVPPVDKIDVTMTYDLPPIAASGGSLVQGTAEFGILNAGYSFDTGTVTINGLSYTGKPMEAIDVGVPAGATTLTVRFQATITGDGADQGFYPLAELGYLRLGISTVNEGQQLICDGGMENYPDTDGTPWQLLSEDLLFGRLGLGVAAFINDIAEGGPACGDGYQVIGRHPPLLNAYLSSPISNAFHWPGGSMYYKFRYRSLDLFGFSPASPNVYIVDQDGGFVQDLYGSNVFDPDLPQRNWTYISGSVELDEGYYFIVLNTGYVNSSINQTNAVYYDDVAVGTSPQEDLCTIDDVPVEEAPTPTATVSPTRTQTPTITRTGTQNPTRTNTGVPTLRPSQTRTPTRQASSTARATATARASATLNSGTATARAPTPSKTPFGHETPIPTLNGTHIVGTNTAVAQGTPNPSVTPGSGQSSGGSGWIPGSSGGTGFGWTGNPVQDCARPGFWDFVNVNKWIDYETCTVVSFISFGSIQQATAQALPARFNQYEPFGTINELYTGVVDLRTQVASYDWNHTGVDGTNDTLDPSKFLQVSGSQDAWASGAEPFDFTPGSPQSTLIIDGSSYNAYCNTKMSSLFSGNLAKGSCYALEFARKIGLLPWVQFFINIACLVTMLRSFLSFLGMAPSYVSLVQHADSEPISTANGKRG